MATCLLLKPLVPDDNDHATDLVTQMKHINLLTQAIKMADLELLGDDPQGTTAVNISDSLIEHVYQAQVVVIDANRYGDPDLSTTLALYYLMALSHTCASKTILVAKSRDCIPFAALEKHHTLIFDGDQLRFLDRFKSAVKEILKGIGKPDNPVQEYFKQLDDQDELARVKADLAARQAQVRKLEDQAGAGRITFRRVTPPLDES